MSQCRGCGARIVWVKTSNDKWTPANLDGTPHWASCPKAAEFKKEKEQKHEHAK